MNEVYDRYIASSVPVIEMIAVLPDSAAHSPASASGG